MRIVVAGGLVFYCEGTNRKLFAFLLLPSRQLFSLQTRTKLLLDDGVSGATGAGVGSLHQLFCLRDCYRSVCHHRPGDFSKFY